MDSTIELRQIKEFQVIATIIPMIWNILKSEHALAIHKKQLFSTTNYIIESTQTGIPDGDIIEPILTKKIFGVKHGIGFVVNLKCLDEKNLETVLEPTARVLVRNLIAAHEKARYVSMPTISKPEYSIMGESVFSCYFHVFM